MKKITLFLLVLAFAAPVFAGVTVTPFAGYTTVSMKKLNAYFERVSQLIIPPAMPGMLKDYTLMRDGYAAGLDIGFSFSPVFFAGIRAEYIGLKDGQSHFYVPPSVIGPDVDFRFRCSMVPVMAGISCAYPVCDSVSLGASAFAGYGFGFYSQYYRTPPIDFTSSYNGGVLVSDLAADLKIKFSGIKAGMQAGYRIANISKMKASDYAPFVLGVVNAGDAAKNAPWNDETLSFDFSGFILNLNASIEF